MSSLGANSYGKNVFVSDTMTAGKTIVQGNEVIDGNLHVKGYTQVDGTLQIKNDATFEKPVTLTVTSDLSVGGYLVATNVVMLPSLPTSDPNNEGQLWNSGGDVRVSAGPPLRT